MTNQTFLFIVNIWSEKYTPWEESKGFNMLILSSPSKCGFVLGFGYCWYITVIHYTGTLFCLITHITAWLRVFCVMAGSTVLKLLLFAMSQVSHVLVQYITVSIKFLLAIFKECAANVIIWLALYA